MGEHEVHLIPKRKDEVEVVVVMVVMEVRVTQSSDQEECGEREGVSFEESGEDCGFDANKEEVVPKVDDVSLVDGVFDGAFGGDGDEDFVIGEGLVVSSSLLVKSTNSFLGRMMVSLIFLKGLEEEAWGEAIELTLFHHVVHLAIGLDNLKFWFGESKRLPLLGEGKDVLSCGFPSSFHLLSSSLGLSEESFFLTERKRMDKGKKEEEREEEGKKCKKKTSSGEERGIEMRVEEGELYEEEMNEGRKKKGERRGRLD
ncbi:hypothetical protein Tco_1073577 [Tanacetum coccineum]